MLQNSQAIVQLRGYLRFTVCQQNADHPAHHRPGGARAVVQVSLRQLAEPLAAVQSASTTVGGAARPRAKKSRVCRRSRTAAGTRETAVDETEGNGEWGGDLVAQTAVFVYAVFVELLTIRWLTTLFRKRCFFHRQSSPREDVAFKRYGVVGQEKPHILDALWRRVAHNPPPWSAPTSLQS